MSRGSAESPQSWSIDELAVLVKLPTRTLREYRTMKLIDPPRMDGRVGRYDESHRRRLELVARLQARGYSLAAIGDLCAASATGRSLDEILGGDSSVVIDDTPVRYTTARLTQIVPSLADERLRRDAVKVGLLHAGAKGDWIVRSPALLALVSDAIAAGASPKAALRLIGGLIKGARLQAAALGELVVNELWDEKAPVTRSTVSTGRRMRLLMSQAAAALVVDAVGVDLVARSKTPGGKGLERLVDELRLGAVHSDVSSARRTSNKS